MPLFLVLYVGHKVWSRTPLMKPLTEVDAWSGMDEVIEMEQQEKLIERRGAVQRLWNWLC